MGETQADPYDGEMEPAAAERYGITEADLQEAEQVSPEEQAARSAVYDALLPLSHAARARALAWLAAVVSPEPGAGDTRWWIATGPLAQGGRKVLGPFDTQDLAMEVRQLLELTKAATFWVDQEVTG